MIVGRIALLALVCACAAEPQTDVRWLINTNTEEVTGLVGRGAAAGSTRAHRFILLECASYDLFVAASEVYQHRAAEQEKPLRGCKALVTAELSREQLKASKQEVVAKLKKEKSLIDSLLEDVSEGLHAGAVFSVLGVSRQHTQLFSKVVGKLKSLNILPQIPAQGRIKKGLVILSTAAMLIASSGILKRKGHAHYQIVLNELSGAEYSHRLQDQESSQESYEEIKRLLIALVEEKGGAKLPPASSKVVHELPRVVAH